ncbi:MAG: hypothetical protein JO025_12220 [Verrucomicrobia bacterium]|nr:hypothetical protein [Verrucomicrobiota bacterium]
MKRLIRKVGFWNNLWIRFWLASATVCLLATHGYAQGALAPAAAPAALTLTTTASSDASGGQFAAQLVQGMNIITASGFMAGCVIVVNGFLNARRDDNWKVIVIHGLGVAGSVALCKTLFSLFIVNRCSIVAPF